MFAIHRTLRPVDFSEPSTRALELQAAYSIDRGERPSLRPPVAVGIRVLNEELLRYLPIAIEVIEMIAEKEKKELERCERVYHGDRALFLAARRDADARLIVTMRPHVNPLSGGC
jgi:hypothetical protein